MADTTTYRFGPLERGGFILGLRVPQLVGFAIAALVALEVLNAGGVGGFIGALIVLVLAAAVLVIPFRGHTLQEWAPLTVRFLLGRLGRRGRFRSQLARVGHVIGLPDPDSGLDPRHPDDPASVPSELATLEYLEVALREFANSRMGVIVDRRARTFTAVLGCQGQAFALLDDVEREQRLADYGGVLAALARDGSPLCRLSWIERTIPGDGDELTRYAMDNLDSEVREQVLRGDAVPEHIVSYLRLTAEAPRVGEQHQLFFCVQIDAQRQSARRAIKRMGGGDLGAGAVLATEVARVAELLEAAGVTVEGVFPRDSVASIMRAGYDPWGDRDRRRASEAGEHYGGRSGGGLASMLAGPMARDEHWSHIRTDQGLHTTLWVAEWPRIDVRSTFLEPLLAQSHTTRSVAMVMELVGPGRATRAVERAATEAASEQALRDRVGQRTTQRQAQKREATERRERELAEGHAEVRYSAFVTVSVRGGEDAVDELEAAVSRIELEGSRGLRLERLWGQQADAFTFTLPLCRGMR